MKKLKLGNFSLLIKLLAISIHTDKIPGATELFVSGICEYTSKLVKY